jgi:NAD(P)H-hydrate epimerase
MLARQAAARSGIGLVRLLVAQPNVAVVQGAAPEAIAAEWPMSPEDARAHVGEWAHTLLLGPGLGRSAETRELAERVLASGDLAAVLDADALNMFEGESGALAKLLRARRAVITPHPMELARLTGVETQAVLDTRFDAGLELARRIGAVVLLKGVPTVVSHPDGRRLVSAAGTPALAAGGSGDILAGIAATLLAQMDDSLESAACAAWVHGRAAELACAGRPLRGVTLDDVLESLPSAWSRELPAARPPVLAELPRIPS